MLAYQDPDHEGNSAKYHTGKSCCVKECKEPAGTWWGELWCFTHNVERMDRIGNSLDDIAHKMELDTLVNKATENWRATVEELARERRALILAAGGSVTLSKELLNREPKGESSTYNRDGSRTVRAY